MDRDDKITYGIISLLVALIMIGIPIAVHVHDVRKQHEISCLAFGGSDC